VNPFPFVISSSFFFCFDHPALQSRENDLVFRCQNTASPLNDRAPQTKKKLSSDVLAASFLRTIKPSVAVFLVDERGVFPFGKIGPLPPPKKR